MAFFRDKNLMIFSGVLSVVLHTVVLSLLTLVVIPSADGPAPTEVSFDLVLADPDVLPEESPPPQPDPVSPEPRERPLMLGIEESDQVTENWIGFAVPTPHAAPLSEVNQAALDPNPAMSAAPVEAVPPPGAPEQIPDVAIPPPPRGEAMSVPAAPPPAPPPPVDAEDLERVMDRVRAAVAAGVKLLTTNEGDEVAAGEDEAVEPASPPKAPESPPSPDPVGPIPEAQSAPDAPTETRQPTSAPSERGESSPAPPSPPVPADPMRADRGSEQSEKESPAASTAETVEIRPGRPAAAEGMDITTRRPVFTTATRALRRPRNPELSITFDRTGRVSEAKIVRSSGAPDVDEPVLNAAYGWTAKGKAIKALASQRDPKAGVTIRVRIILQ
jgi:periplasmic protein TonB